MKRIKRLIRKWIGCDCKECDCKGKNNTLQLPTEINNPKIIYKEPKVLNLRSYKEFERYQLHNLPETLLRREAENEILEELRKHIDIEVVEGLHTDKVGVRGSIKVISRPNK